ncbi:hypothetical protein ACO22_07685 [Paracoccidioides brasiliensis]|uniref:Uncharacterized protein n=1 Tax=Paracoccidioides brasiliensis TaxID=121759 RepID=A0A1D2J3Z0_PARBR|nr:hypothetical protein ACO22_07685 [Paracoccidioides brasiliensis]
MVVILWKRKNIVLIRTPKRGIMPREDTLRYARGTSASALTLLNIFLLVALGSQQELSFIGMRHKCATERTPPPYSPVREDGFVRYVNKRFTPSKLFQFGPSDEVEEAGNETLACMTTLLLFSFPTSAA